MITDRLTLPLLVLAVLAAGPAHARFGKGGSSSGSRSSSSSHSSSSSSHSSHSAVPVGSSHSSSYDRTSSTGYVSSYGSYRPYRYGFYSGAYVPMYGYGYGYYAPLGAATLVAPAATVRPEPAEELRVTAAAEVQVFVRTESGIGLAGSAAFEGERWGFAATGQALSLASRDVVGATDTLQQVNLRLTYAFLTGKYGRLRGEFGADTVFASDLIAVGPTGGVSGSVWLGGPFAIEGAVAVTPLPFTQLEYRANVAVGLGALGLRLGWRTQVLDDQGIVDGVAHRDVFQGPFGGAAFVF